MLCQYFMPHIQRILGPLITCLLFFLAGRLAAAESVSTGRACLRDFAEIYSLQTEGLKADERLTRTYTLLGTKLNLSAEVVSQALAKEVELKMQDSTASALNRARALFIQSSFAKAEQLAINSGDQAHRSTPRRIDDLVASLRLAAYSAMEQQQWQAAIKYLTVAVTETDSQKELTTWAALQTGISHAQKKMGLIDEYERTLWFIFHEYEQRVGLETVETLHHQNELAACLYERGKDVEAEKQSRLILKATLKVRGKDHTDTQAARKNLARLLEIQQKFAEAEILRRDVYDAQYRVLGGQALTTLKSREQLILNLIGQNKFSEAEMVSDALAKKATGALGQDAPIALEGRALKLTALISQSQFEPALAQAEVLAEDALRVLGQDHLVTQKASFCQGGCLNQLKRFTEALPILSRVLATRQRLLPPDDDATLQTEHELSLCYLGLEKPKEALDHLRIVLTSYEKIYGQAHPKTQAVNQTANTLINTPAGKQVLIEERRALLAKTTAKLGADHAQSMGERFNLAAFIASLGLGQEALAEHLLVLAARRQKLGVDAPQTLDSLRAVALLEMDLLKFGEAEQHLRELLAGRQKRLKPSDLAIQESRYQLGLCLGRAGKLGESLSLVESSYLTVKDQEGVNQPFLAQMKQVLDQLYALSAPKPKNFDALTVPAPLTVQQAPLLKPEVSANSSMEAAAAGASGPALPAPASLVPSDSIQKHIQVR
jgi:Tetratricopeptide repeat